MKEIMINITNMPMIVEIDNRLLHACPCKFQAELAYLKTIHIVHI
jgi:hypothetical protein